MTNETTRLIAVIAEEITELRPDTEQPRLDPDDEIAGLGLDSVDTLELIARLEQRESAAIPDAALDHLRTVADVIDLLHEYRNQ